MIYDNDNLACTMTCKKYELIYSKQIFNSQYQQQQGYVSNVAQGIRETKAFRPSNPQTFL